MKIEKLGVYNFQNAIRGMRNPLNSWDKSDSKNQVDGFNLGPADLKLCSSLIRGGTEHRKFLRQIFVSMDITAPLYWWKEMDTYKIGTTANSTSTMHTLAKSEITKSNFEFGDFHNVKISENEDISFVWNLLIEKLETIRKVYNATGDKDAWKELIRLLPESWLQTRTWTANYEVLLNIYNQRHNHRLPEWRDFCEQLLEELPYFKEFVEVYMNNSTSKEEE